MREITEASVAAVRYRLAWHMWMLRSGRREVRRLSEKQNVSRCRRPDVARLKARYQRGVDEDATTVTKLRTQLGSMQAGQNPGLSPHKCDASP